MRSTPEPGSIPDLRRATLVVVGVSAPIREAFGSYEIVRRLGAGGMAEVCLAVRRGPAGFEQEVCLKRVLSAYSDDEEFQKMFLIEARLAARVRHANIVQVYDFGEVGGVYYLALEFVDGTDLRKLLRELAKHGRTLEVTLAVWIARQVLDALSCVHTATENGRPMGLVHRDISPSNILLSRHGEVKLADFGVAKATKAAVATASNAIKGKPSYMPVEQLESDADARSDLFALGVVMYEMIAGKRPFDGPTDVGTMQRIMKGEFVPLRDVAPHTPEPLGRVVDRLLQKDRSARFATAHDVADALLEVAAAPSCRRALGKLVCEHAPVERSDDAKAPTESGVRSTSSHDPPPVEGEPPAIPKTQALDTSPDETSAVPPASPAGDDATVALESSDAGRAAPAEVHVPHDARPARRAPTARRLAIGLAAVAALAAAVTALFTYSSEPRPRPSASPPTGAAPPVDRGTSMEPPAPPTSARPIAAEDQGDSPGSDTPPAAGGQERPVEIATAENGASVEGDAPTDSPREVSEGATSVGRDPASNPERAYGTVSVAVFPGGRVWIDGRFAGNAPITRRVTAGTHRIGAGASHPTTSQSVRVIPGGRHQVTLRLLE